MRSRHENSLESSIFLSGLCREIVRCKFAVLYFEVQVKLGNIKLPLRTLGREQFSAATSADLACVSDEGVESAFYCCIF